MFDYPAKLLRVIDGDTVVLDIDLGFDVSIRQTVRLFGINAPEIHAKDPTEKMMGIRARDRLSEILGHGTTKLRVVTVKGNDKYGRYLADIFVSTLEASSFSVSDTLIAENLVFVYDGKTKVGRLSDLKPL